MSGEMHVRFRVRVITCFILPSFSSSSLEEDNDDGMLCGLPMAMGLGYNESAL